MPHGIWTLGAPTCMADVLDRIHVRCSPSRAAVAISVFKIECGVPRAQSCSRRLSLVSNPALDLGRRSTLGSRVAGPAQELCVVVPSQMAGPRHQIKGTQHRPEEGPVRREVAVER
jgi:hypothetical protein